MLSKDIVNKLLKGVKSDLGKDFKITKKQLTDINNGIISMRDSGWNPTMKDVYIIAESSERNARLSKYTGYLKVRKVLNDLYELGNY